MTSIILAINITHIKLLTGMSWTTFMMTYLMTVLTICWSSWCVQIRCYGEQNGKKIEKLQKLQYGDYSINK